MAVGNFTTIDACGIACNAVFCNRISDLLAGFIFRKLAKTVTPVISGADFLTLYFCSCTCHRLHQVNGNLIRAFTILIFLIIPFLNYFIVYDLRLIGVRNVKVLNFRSVICHSIFRNRILDFLTCFILRLSHKSSGPFPFRISCHFLAGYFLSIC